MNSGSLNKWLGALLSAMLVMFGLRTIIMEATPEGPPAKPGYVVAETAESAGGGAAEAKPAADPPVADVLKKADADHGQALTKPCQACHTFDKGGAAKVGPNLYGVVGRKVASMDGFAYSDGLKAMGGSWDYDHIYKFLASPKAMVSGTKMGFAGYPKPEDRADVIAYLRTLSDNPVPLP